MEHDRRLLKSSGWNGRRHRRLFPNLVHSKASAWSAPGSSLRSRISAPSSVNSARRSFTSSDLAAIRFATPRLSMHGCDEAEVAKNKLSMGLDLKNAARNRAPDGALENLRCMDGIVGAWHS
jgi:hypothetical protein